VLYGIGTELSGSDEQKNQLISNVKKMNKPVNLLQDVEVIDKRPPETPVFLLFDSKIGSFK